MISLCTLLLASRPESFKPRDCIFLRDCELELLVAEAAQEAWNALSKPDQYKFNNEAKILKQQYDSKIEEFTKRLAEREQRLAEGITASKLNKVGYRSFMIDLLESTVADEKS